MRFINNDSVVLFQQRIILRFCQQNAVGHHFNGGIFRHAVGEPNFKAHYFPQRGMHLFRNAGSNRTRRYPSRLGMPNNALLTETELQAYLW